MCVEDGAWIGGAEKMCGTGECCRRFLLWLSSCTCMPRQHFDGGELLAWMVRGDLFGVKRVHFFVCAQDAEYNKRVVRSSPAKDRFKAVLGKKKCHS